MPIAAQNAQFSNAQFTLSDLLKFVQENGSKTLWKEVNGLDAITKKAEWQGGKEVTYHLTVDAGGGAFAGIDLNGGLFAPNDPTFGIQGRAVPKYQAFTVYYERFLNKLTNSSAKAYLNSVKQEFEQKTMFAKSFLNLQQLGDGTGRFATPIGLGASDTASGASFSQANLSPMKIKLSNLDTAVGSAAHLMEGSMVSFFYASYDDDNNGSYDLSETTCKPRLLVLNFNDGVHTAVKYDAFRVVKVAQEENAVYVFPGRIYTAGATSPGNYVQQGYWVDGVSNVTASTVTPYEGFTNGYAAAASAATLNNGFDAVFAPTGKTTAVYLVHPLYLPSGSTSWSVGNQDFSSYSVATKTADEIGRLLLGLGWTGATDVSMLNPYLMTGVETLLMNDTNTVHGIPRSAVKQYLPTIKDNQARPLTFNTFFAMLAEHFNRNRALTSDWNVCMMNPMVYSSLISLSEMDRRITEGKGIRGEDGAKIIKMGGKNYQMEMETFMRADRVFCLPKGSIELHGGTIEPVATDAGKEFLALHNTMNRRINAVESYNTVMGEMLMRAPRDAAAVRNFTIQTY